PHRDAGRVATRAVLVLGDAAGDAARFQIGCPDIEGLAALADDPAVRDRLHGQYRPCHRRASPEAGGRRLREEQRRRWAKPVMRRCSRAMRIRPLPAWAYCPALPWRPCRAHYAPWK